jgi:hypothetical protein
MVFAIRLNTPTGVDLYYIIVYLKFISQSLNNVMWRRKEEDFIEFTDQISQRSILRMTSVAELKNCLKG